MWINVPLKKEIDSNQNLELGFFFSFGESMKVSLLISDRNEECPKLCMTLEYFKEGRNVEYKSNKSTFGIIYTFLISDSITVYDNYLIYDTITMIGSVGGTLGMCIGFSFTGHHSGENHFFLLAHEQHLGHYLIF